MSTIEQVIWRGVHVEKPNSDRVVLVHMPRSKEWPVWLGYLNNDGAWVGVDGDELEHEVAYWAEMPTGAG